MTAADDGSADRRLAVALAGQDSSAAAASELLAALAGARVFLAMATRSWGSPPTTSLPDEPSNLPPAGVHTATGPSPAAPASAHGTATELAVMSIRGASGARALPAFAAGRDVQRWQPQARPIPVPGPQACVTALQDGADVLLLDPLGAAVPVTGRALRELAAGRVPVSGAALSTHYGDLVAGVNAEPDLLAALGRALRGEPVRAARVLTGPDGMVLAVTADLGAAATAALAARLRDRLGPDLPATGLDLTVTAYDGPGQPVPLATAAGRRPWRLGGRSAGGPPGRGE